MTDPLAVALNDPTVSPGASRNSFFQFLKQQYFPELNAFLHVGTEVPKYVANKKGEMGGKLSVMVAATAYPPAGIGRFEGHNAPPPRPTTGINPVIIARSMMYRLRWTMEVEAAARKGDQVAWRNPMQLDMEMAREQFEQTFARKLVSGPFDVLGRVNGTPSGTPAGQNEIVTLYSRNNRTSTNFFDVGLQYIKANQDVAVVRAASTYGGVLQDDHLNAKDKGLKVISTDPSSTTSPTFTGGTDADLATHTDPSSFATGDYVVAYAERLAGTTAYGSSVGGGGSQDTANMISCYQGLNGLDNVLTGTQVYTALMGIVKNDSTNYPSGNTLLSFYQANGGNTRQYSERLIDVGLRFVRENTGSLPKVVLCAPASLTEHARENRGDRLFQPVITESGYGKLTYNFGGQMIPIEEDWLIKPGMFYGFDPAHYGFYEARPLSPVDKEFQYRFIQDVAASEVFAAKMGNVAHQRPFAGFCIDDTIFDCFSVTP